MSSGSGKYMLRLSRFTAEPSFLAAVTGTEYAYTRPDGVHVMPVGCLRDRRAPRIQTP